MTNNEIAEVIIKSFAERSFQAFLTSYSRRGMDEADVFGVNTNGYMYEYEIKRSRGDYLAEFKNKEYKHEKLKNGDAIRTYNIWEKGKRTEETHDVIIIPNRYYFACEEGLIKPDEVPEYAGLVYIINGEIHEQKPAKLLHRNKANELIYKGIANVLSQRIIFGCSYYTYQNSNQ